MMLIELGKKGMIWHYSIIGVVVAVAVFLIVTVDTDLLITSKGEWQSNFIKNYVVFGEKKLVQIDQISMDLVKQLQGEIYAKNKGCFKENGVAFWNQQDVFCLTDIREDLADGFNLKLKQQFANTEFSAITYSLTFDAGYLVGTADKSLNVGGGGGLKAQATNNLPQEEFECLLSDNVPYFSNGNFVGCVSCPQSVDCSDYMDRFYCDLDPCQGGCVSFFADGNYDECGECPQEAACDDYINQYYCTLDPCGYGCTWQINRCESGNGVQLADITEKIFYVRNPGYLGEKTSYSFYPHFRLKTPMANLDLIQNEAVRLYEVCKNSLNLQSCLNREKQHEWSYSSCTQPSYPQGTKRIPFCVDQLTFGIDFSTDELYSIDNVGLDCTSNCEISWSNIADAEQYTIHYTNWPSVQGTQGQASVLFPDSILALGFVYDSLSFPALQNEGCSSVLGQANLCNNQITYVLDSSNLDSGEYYFAITYTKTGQESDINHFEQTTIP